MGSKAKPDAALITAEYYARIVAEAHERFNAFAAEMDQLQRANPLFEIQCEMSIVTMAAPGQGSQILFKSDFHL